MSFATKPLSRSAGACASARRPPNRCSRHSSPELDYTRQHTPIELLGYNDDPATRDLLLRLLAQVPNSWLLEAVVASARRLWGADSPEPDYAAVQNPQADADEREEMFRRLQE